MKIFLISDNVDTQTGLRLAGIDGVVVHERNELKNALESVLLNKEVAIILITEKLSFEFPEIIDDIKLHRNEALLVTIPDRHGLGRSDFITSYVEDAIGLKL